MILALAQTRDQGARREARQGRGIMVEIRFFVRTKSVNDETSMEDRTSVPSIVYVSLDNLVHRVVAYNEGKSMNH